MVTIMVLILVILFLSAFGGIACDIVGWREVSDVLFFKVFFPLAIIGLVLAFFM